jgi:hypothetical protein
MAVALNRRYRDYLHPKYSEVLPGLTARGRPGWLLVRLPGRTR